MRVATWVFIVGLICGHLLGSYGDASLCMWGGAAESPQPRPRILDITHEYRPDLPVFNKFDNSGLGKVVSLLKSIANGSVYNESELKIGVHSGTHVDAPSHFLQEAFESGHDTNSLDLEVLNGPVLVVDTPRSSNISEKVLMDLNIPSGVERVLFRTLNSDRRLMWNPVFAKDFTGFVKGGADWLVSHTSINLIGVDYLSVAVYDQLADVHRTLFKKNVVIIEGLNLDNASLGLHVLHCLPARIVGSEGAPVRCILVD